MVSSPSGRAATQGQVVGQPAFGDRELSEGDEDRGQRPVPVSTHVAKLEARPPEGQALEGEFDLRKALEFDVEPGDIQILRGEHGLLHGGQLRTQ